jgi:hypothetical protein
MVRIKTPRDKDSSLRPGKRPADELYTINKVWSMRSISQIGVFVLGKDVLVSGDTTQRTK